MLATIALVVATAQPAPGTDAAAALTDLVTASIAREPRFDVIASGDVRKQIELEADKQAVGCAASTSCLAEVAGALGAKAVVYGSLAQLGDVFILTLNLFDSQKGEAVGRVVLKEASTQALAEHIDAAASELTSTYAATIPAGSRAKVLVLDLDARVTAAEPGPPWAAWATVGGGVVLAGLGAGALAFGASADVTADTTADRGIATGKYAERNAWGAVGLTAVGAGVVVVAGGVVLLLVPTGGAE